MIARQMGGHAAFGLGLGERKHAIAGAAKFKRPGLLKIFALEIQLSIGHVIQAGAGQHRDVVGIGSNAGGGLANIVDGWQWHERLLCVPFGVLASSIAMSVSP